MEPKIITSAAYKGGVGKTRLSYELAFLLDAPLIDFDYDDGGATLMWGYEPSQTGRGTILDGFTSDRVPRPLWGRLGPGATVWRRQQAGPRAVSPRDRRAASHGRSRGCPPARRALGK